MLIACNNEGTKNPGCFLIGAHITIIRSGFFVIFHVLCSVQDLSVIQQQLTSEELFEAFRQQLIRDFDRSGVSANFAEGLTHHYQGLVAQIANELRECDKRSSTHIARLLYNVDISEAQLKKYLQEAGDADHWVVMAQLMVKRLLQKVVIRQHYKNKPGPTE
jgi:hypothetical protein